MRTFEDDSVFALKIMKKASIVKQKQFHHVMNEFHIMAITSHPFIVDMVGNFQDENRLYIILEYIPGGELFTLLRNEKAISQTAAIFYSCELILALEYLHKLSIAFRDLKPENVLLRANGHIKICDFGLAKIISDRTFTLCGTAEYLAPEMIKNVGHGMSVDWWALGILVYEMLCGHPPFSGKTPYDTYRLICAGKPHFPKSFSPLTKDFVKRLLQDDRRVRLGCMKGGTKTVKAHKWLSGVDWSAVYNCQAQVPYLIEVDGQLDSANFQKYPDSLEDDAIPLNGDDREKFLRLKEWE